MWNIPLIPDSASTTASRVDALFLFELGITTFFSALIAFLILYMAVHIAGGRRWTGRILPSRAS